MKVIMGIPVNYWCIYELRTELKNILLKKKRANRREYGSYRIRVNERKSEVDG